MIVWDLWGCCYLGLSEGVEKGICWDVLIRVEVEDMDRGV